MDLIDIVSGIGAPLLYRIIIARCACVRAVRADT